MIKSKTLFNTQDPSSGGTKVASVVARRRRGARAPTTSAKYISEISMIFSKYKSQN